MARRITMIQNSLAVLADCSLVCSQTGYRNAERRAADVIDADSVEEIDGIRISTMFPADSALEVRTLAASTLDSMLDKFADTLHVDGLERVRIEDLVSEIVTHEGTHVVA